MENHQFEQRKSPKKMWIFHSDVTLVGGFWPSISGKVVSCALGPFGTHIGAIFSTRPRDQPWILNSLGHVSFKSCWFYHIFVGSVRCLWLRQRFGSKPFTVERAEYIPRACSVSFSLVVANFITILMQWITPLFDAALPVVVWWYPCFYDKLLFTLTTLFDS